MKHIPEAGNLNYGMSEYAAYFIYTIIQISRYSNMLQMCRALGKCVPRLNLESYSGILIAFDSQEIPNTYQHVNYFHACVFYVFVGF